MNKFYSFPVVLLLFFQSVLFTSGLQAQAFIRGPYLQSPGPNSIIVRWRTDSLCESRVAWGNTLGSTAFVVDDSTLTTEHIVKLTGLNPRTTYYYMVGTFTGPMRGPDAAMHFTTAPDTANPTPVRLWCIGDFGHGNAAQASVRDAYMQYAQNKPADLQLWLGDNAYSDGTDAEFTSKVFDSIYGYHDQMLNLPFVSTSGNHDYNSICPWQPFFCTQDPNTHTGPYLDLISPPTEGELGGVPSHTKLFYSMDYGNIHFVILNSELGSLNNSYNWAGILNSDTGFTSPMLDWLKQDLAATTKTWKIVIWHQCPYSGQNNFTDDGVQVFCIATRTHFNPIIESYGADLVLTGHDHNYQRSYLINGHYDGKNTFTPAMMINGSNGNEGEGTPYIKYTDGPLKDKGTVYVLEGNSSEGNDASPIEHPAIYWGEACGTCFGSFIVDVDGNKLTGRYLTSTDSIRDEFTIIKQSWTGLQETPAFDHADVFPNPFTNQVTVGYTLLTKTAVKVEVIDALGRVVTSQNPGVHEPGNYHDAIDFTKAPLAKGNYVLRLTAGNDVKNLKLQKVE